MSSHSDASKGDALSEVVHRQIGRCDPPSGLLRRNGDPLNMMQDARSRRRGPKCGSANDARQGSMIESGADGDH
jgi:hypothetical protein